MEKNNKKLGIIQSRGLGDIFIALPIAHYYHKQGYEIYWPVCDEFMGSLVSPVPWVNWISVPVDPQGLYFYDVPVSLLENEGVEQVLCLYQSLTGHPEFTRVPWFQIQKFDEYKYTRTGVPFVNKWKLGECITRDPEQELTLFNKVVKHHQYYVTHLEGSNFNTDIDLPDLPDSWQRVSITPGLTDNIFDWLTIIENAQLLVCIDSCVANLVDQLGLPVKEKIWIPRSHIHATPVLGGTWTIATPPAISAAAREIFKTS